MSVKVIIRGTPIDFPTSGESPDWAPAIVEFAKAVEDAILVSSGPYDIPETDFILTTNSITTPLDIDDLSFSTAAVRAAFVKYTVYRKLGATIKTETGSLLLNYNDTTWEMSRDFVGDADCSFNVNNNGQLQITTVLIPGSGTYEGVVTFSAQALSQTN